MFCANCGCEAKPEDHFCSSCGIARSSLGPSSLNKPKQVSEELVPRSAERNSFRRWFLLPAVIVAGVAAIGYAGGEGRSSELWQSQQKALQDEKRLRDEKFSLMSSKQHLSIAKNPLTTPEQALKHLAAIDSSSTEAPEAKRMTVQIQNSQTKALRTKQADEIQTDIVIRDAMAKTTENLLLGEGYSVDVTAAGKEHRTLHLRWALVSKALAYQLSTDNELMSSLKRTGFRTVEITDGYEETYTWKLN